jgi:hypothetical protein
MADPTLFQQIVMETQPFFGKRADEFIRRQCAHIRVPPEMLQKKDIQFLVYWVSSSAKLVLSKENASLLAQKITALGQGE